MPVGAISHDRRNDLAVTAACTIRSLPGRGGSQALRCSTFDRRVHAYVDQGSHTRNPNMCVRQIVFVCDLL
jgi:hypothetical protein